MNQLVELQKLGQSLWYDNIERRLLENGTLAKMVKQGDIRGITSNPSIFNNAIAKSNDYDSALTPMAWAGLSAKEIFNRLAIEDIQSAADLFAPLYNETNGADGYVSLEVNPTLAHDTAGTIEEAKTLWKLVDRPNLMIKIPATIEGIPAVKEVLSAGINVNVTLIFSIKRYEAVINAYLEALESRLKRGERIDRIASVASFFVSRVDSKVDVYLKNIASGKDQAFSTKTNQLMGKAAIANSRLAYALYQSIFESPRFDLLKKASGRTQRPLWASTSTKNPNYRDVIYIEELIAPDSVNTVPPQTLEAFRDHGKPALMDLGLIKEAEKTFADLQSVGIDMDVVTAELETEGVKAFEDAFQSLMETIQKRIEETKKKINPLKDKVSKTSADFEKKQVVGRMWQGDSSLWTRDEAGQHTINDRLGWLYLPDSSSNLVSEITQLKKLISPKIKKIVLLGMGGSSLAPEVFSLLYSLGNKDKKIEKDFLILDSTDPQQVLAIAESSKVDQTLFLVSSKSGSTIEVQSFFDYFWGWVSKEEPDKEGEHFIAITDPGTSLAKLAAEKKFLKTFLSDPKVGGRYSALTAFGLVPAGLMGYDIALFLENAKRMSSVCKPEIPVSRNPAALLGIILGEGALIGKDKLTILADPELDSFGSWLEQLIAESSGKEGKGIVPVDREEVRSSGFYSSDRLFVYLRHNGKLDGLINELEEKGQPVISYQINHCIDIAGEMYRWEFATAVACIILGVNAFDQPDVQDNKIRTVKIISDFSQKGILEEGNFIKTANGIKYFGNTLENITPTTSLGEILNELLKTKKPGEYLAINAYLPRNEHIDAALQKFRKILGDRSGLPTTLGYGPRFLHSTGQLHKGGANNGIFIMITADNEKDFPISGQGLSFGTLERAQAIGDLETLVSRGRRLIRVHLPAGKISLLDI